MKYHALVFDFDGTIADTLDEGLRIYNQIAADLDLQTIGDDEVPHLRTLTINNLLIHLGIPKRMVPTLLYRGTRELKSKIPSLPLIKGMADALPRLRQQCDHFGILTSNSVENVNLFLESHGIADLFTFVSSTSKLSGKASYLRGMLKKYSLSPDRLIYIGDEVRDIKAAKKAGVASTAVSWGFNCEEALREVKPDFLCASPDELLEVVL